MEELNTILNLMLGGEEPPAPEPAFTEKVTSRTKTSRRTKRMEEEKSTRIGRRRGGPQTQALSEIDEALAAEEKKLEEARKKLKAQIARS